MILWFVENMAKIQIYFFPLVLVTGTRLDFVFLIMNHVVQPNSCCKSWNSNPFDSRLNRANCNDQAQLINKILYCT